MFLKHCEMMILIHLLCTLGIPVKKWLIYPDLIFMSINVLVMV